MTEASQEQRERTPTEAAGASPRAKGARRAPAPEHNGARNLVIVESPAKARTIANILGKDYKVIASVGHVRDLPEHGYGLKDFETFEPKYVIVKERGVDKRQVVKEIAEAAKSAERVYLSTDPDREGEAISWHIVEAAKIPREKAKRVVFHEITPAAVQEAFQHPGEINERLVEAQKARRVLDRLVGYPLTWFVQSKVRRDASAGRGQSVALRLIVEREREIQNFVPKEYWTIHADLAKDGVPFRADLARLPGQQGKPEIPDEATARQLTATFERCEFRVVSVKRGTRSRAPLPPFTTSTFQQAANNRLGMSAARAMAIAQELYEGIELPGQGPVGLITYMRTDSLHVAPEARREAREDIANRWGVDYVPPKERIYRTRARGAQEAHEAIRPTDPRRTPDSLRGALNRDQLAVYTLIWQRFLASQMSDARYSTVQVEIEARERTQRRGTFRASAQPLEFPGHLAVYAAEASDPQEGEDDSERSLPPLAEGDVLERRGIEAKQHFTEPPPRYTEATLIKKLEELGIGRPSTYATIVQTVLKRDYVKKEGRQLVPQELGFIVNDLLVKHLDKYVEPEFTSRMEEQLDEIARGEASYLPVVKSFWETFEKEGKTARAEAERQEEPTDIPCDVCGQANMVIRWGRRGKFLACPRFPACKNAKPLTEEGTPAPTGPEPTEYRCPRCGGALYRRTGPFGPYVACERRETGECDFTSGVPVGVRCPEDGGELVARRTRRGTFYGCWNYPSCSYTTNSLEPEKMAPPRPPEERAQANAKLLERSARAKAAAATRRSRRAS